MPSIMVPTARSKTVAASSAAYPALSVPVRYARTSPVLSASAMMVTSRWKRSSVEGCRNWAAVLHRIARTERRKRMAASSGVAVSWARVGCWEEAV
ncbi:MAG: hypothetical protein P8170_07890 [Gemmatimonadota bacterium]